MVCAFSPTLPSPNLPSPALLAAEKQLRFSLMASSPCRLSFLFLVPLSLLGHLDLRACVKRKKKVPPIQVETLELSDSFSILCPVGRDSPKVSFLSSVPSLGFETQGPGNLKY